MLIVETITNQAFNSILLGMLGGQEIIIILAVILIFLGGRQTPKILKSFGKWFNLFKKADNIRTSKTNILTKIIQLFTDEK